MTGTSQHGTQPDNAMANYLSQLKKLHKRGEAFDRNKEISLSNQFWDYPPAFAPLFH